MITNLIENLESTITSMGFKIEERKMDDFLYFISVPYKEEIIIIYTTQNAVKKDGEFCFRMYRLKERVSFNSITPSKIESFIWEKNKPYLMKDLEVPIRYKKEEPGIFVPVYLEEIKKHRIDKYNYLLRGITVQEIKARIV